MSTETTSSSPRNAAQTGADLVSLRRALVLVGMAFALPGSAQLLAGSKRVGRIALRIWGTVLGLVVLFGLGLLFLRTWTVGLYANAIVPTIIGWGGLALGIGWAALVVDAWRLARPRQLSAARQALVGGVAVLLAATLATGSWLVSGNFRAQGSLFGSLFTGGGSSQANNGRINILLLGGDAGADRVGLRPDSITVASVSVATGRTILFSLPRNLERVPFPTSNPLYKLYPNGYWCQNQSCLLNAVWTLADDNKKLFPGVANPGLLTTKQVVEQILGLTINYYALADMAAFQNLIDAVGGINLNIPYDVPIGEDGRPVTYYIRAGSNVHLDGETALAFARTRMASNDYARMMRQKCVMNAMLKQLNPTNVLMKFNDIAAAGQQLLKTDVPSSDVNILIDLALKARALPIASLSFAPPDYAPANPDFAKMREAVRAIIAASDKADKAPVQASVAPVSSAKSASAGASTATSGTATSKAPVIKTSPTATAYQPGQTEDLESVCSVA